MKDVYLLKDNANLWHQQFTYIKNGASYCYLGWTTVFSPLNSFGSSKYTDCVLDMSIPQSDNTFLVLSIIASDFVEEIDCNVRKSRQNDFEFS